MLQTEQTRMQAAVRYGAIAMHCEEALNRLMRLAARLLQAPIALVTLVDHERIWLRARHGLDVKSTPLEPGLCASCVLQNDPWIIPDATSDPRTRLNSLVKGTPGVRSYLGIPLQSSDGHNIGTLAVIDFKPKQPSEIDISNARDLAAIAMHSLEQKLQREQREARIKVLMRELAHRSKNLLAVVHSITRQTAGANPVVRQYADGLTQRIKALADTHELLAVEDWFGTSLHQLLTRQLSPLMSGDQARITLNGPSLFLNAKAAQNIGLAIHELATNALQFGVLSTPTGSVEITWKLDGADPAASRLKLSWLERGARLTMPDGPPGFGSLVLTRLTPAALEGSAHYAILDHGALWILDVPLAGVNQ